MIEIAVETGDCASDLVAGRLKQCDGVHVILIVPANHKATRWSFNMHIIIRMFECPYYKTGSVNKLGADGSKKVGEACPNKNVCQDNKALYRMQ
jgi:hypothetical protein